MIRNFVLVFCLFSIYYSLFAQRVIYKAKTFIAPRKYVEDEVPPEKKRPKSYSNACAKYTVEKKEYNGEPVLTDTVVSFLSRNDYRKSGLKYFTKSDFSYILQLVDPLKNQDKTICVQENEGVFAPFDSHKAKIDQSGNHIIGVVVVDSDGNFSQIFRFEVQIDRTPPEIEVGYETGNEKDIQKSNCSKGSRIELSAIDKEHRLTHIYYRLKSDQIWNYYHKPIIIEDDENFQLETKAVDFVGNESKSKLITCKGAW